MLLNACKITHPNKNRSFAHPGRVGVVIPISIYHFVIYLLCLLAGTKHQADYAYTHIKLHVMILVINNSVLGKGWL